MYIKFIFIFLIPFLLVAQTLYAQSFSKASGTPFQGVRFSSIAFADVDGDNDNDLLLTGDTLLEDPVTTLYTNDGQGNFSKVPGTPFDSVYQSSIAFADVDGDNDQDVLITGNNGSVNISKLYTNDGQGNFSEVMGAPFDGVSRSSIAFVDVDGDNDQDVLLTGYNNSNNRISKLYINDGQGNFSVKAGTPFEGVWEGSIAFADVDGDNDKDLLLTGGNSSYDPVSKLYTNDGQGNFSQVTNTSFESVDRSSVAFADVDGDNDKDVLITGLNNSAEFVAKLYINDGQANFSEATGTPFEGVNESSIAFAEVDGDNDKDVLLTGKNSSFDTISTLYTNDGQGNFSEVMGTPFDNVHRSSIGFADVDGDNDQDVLLTGTNSNFERIAKLYINEQNVSVRNDLNKPASIDVLPYPNPTRGKHLHVRYNAPKNGNVLFKVYGMKGDLVKQQKEFAKTGQQTLSIKLPSLAQGSYILEMRQGKRKGYAKFTVH